MTNIYQKQMNKLKLNAKQYAELTGMPYEVVKDILYNKEGDYSMEIKNLLRKNMMNKHQEIENNYENAKIKALELKHESNSMNWYINDYTPELLTEILKLKSRKAFEDKYRIIVDDKLASHWFYTCILGKINYDNHEIRKEVVEQFVEQLYDIIVNKNADAYLKTSTDKIEVKHHKKTSILKWFKNFDFKKYLKENDISRGELARICGVNYTTLCHLMNKGKKANYETEAMRKIYNYIHDINEDNETSDTLMQLREMQNNEPVFISQKEEPKIEIINNDNDEILRKILINRLTEEEKELIRLFGGKIC